MAELRERGAVPITADDLWNCWPRWDWSLFSIEGDSDDPSRVRVVARVRRWNPADLFLFCVAQVQKAVLRWFGQWAPEDERPLRAVEAARAFAVGEIDAATLATARAEAIAAWREISPANASVFQATEEERQTVRAKLVAMAAALLATPDAPDEPVGTHARQAMDRVFEASCHNPGGWIAAKVLGRHREADLCEYIGVGTPAEWAASREGRTLSGEWRPVRQVWGVSSGAVIDAVNPDRDQ
jgi:hypothetical protein